MKVESAIRPRGFTLIELLVVISIIGILIGLLLPDINSARESATVASQFDDLRPVALDVLSITQPESKLNDALIKVQRIVSIVQDEHELPDPEMVATALQELQDAEGALRQDLAALQNPASKHTPGELEAYLDLKHDLQEVANRVHVAEIQVQKLTNVATP